jgi:hypothetical protein
MRMTAIEQYQFALPDVRGATSAARNPDTGFLPPILNYDERKSDVAMNGALLAARTFPSSDCASTSFRNPRRPELHLSTCWFSRKHFRLPALLRRR